MTLIIAQQKRMRDSNYSAFRIEFSTSDLRQLDFNYTVKSRLTLALYGRRGGRVSKDCPYRIFCAAHGGCRSPNQTVWFKQFVDLLESGEPNFRGHACATKHSSETDLKGPSRDNA